MAVVEVVVAVEQQQGGRGVLLLAAIPSVNVDGMFKIPSGTLYVLFDMCS